MRTRNFTYSTKNANEQQLRLIECTYHIYGFQNGELNGFIQFPSGKSIKAAQKIIGYPTSIPNKSTGDTQMTISQMENVWEQGDPPQRSRETVKSKNYNQSDELELLRKLIINHHEEMKEMMESLREERQLNVDIVKLLQEKFKFDNRG